jgi:hypothetical protein
MDVLKYENVQKCMPVAGGMIGTQVSRLKSGHEPTSGLIIGGMVDLESSLWGITNPLTKCASYKNGPIVDNKIPGQTMFKPYNIPPVDLGAMYHQPSCDLLNAKLHQTKLPQYPTGSC